MQNKPLYKLIEDSASPKLKHRRSWFLKRGTPIEWILCLSVIFLCAGLYGFSEWQKAKAKTDFVIWCIKYRPYWTPEMIQEKWTKTRILNGELE